MPESVDVLVVSPAITDADGGVAITLRGHYATPSKTSRAGYGYGTSVMRSFDIVSMVELSGSGSKSLRDAKSRLRPEMDDESMPELRCLVISNGWPSASSEVDFSDVNRVVTISSGTDVPLREHLTTVGFTWLVSWMRPRLENAGIAGKNYLERGQLADLKSALQVARRDIVKSEDEQGGVERFMRPEDLMTATFGLALWELVECGPMDSAPIDYGHWDNVFVA